MSRDIQEAVFFTINVLKLFVSLFFLSVTNKNLFEIPEAGFFFTKQVILRFVLVPLMALKP